MEFAKQWTLRKKLAVTKEEKQALALERAVKYVENLKAQGFDEDTIRNLHTSIERVAFLCAKHPSVKGNYRLLWFYYQKEFEKKTGNFERDFVRGCSPETISRAYRKLAEHGFCLPSVKTSLVRAERERVLKNELSEW